jgi:hypothetical protein
MRSTAPSPNRLATIDDATLVDLCAAAHHRYTRCSAGEASRYVPSIIDLELELIRRRVPFDAPTEPDVPLGNLDDALLRQATALQRIHRSSRARDMETFRASTFYLSPEDVPEAWNLAYAFRGDLHDLGYVLEAIFLTAYTHREGSSAACAAHEALFSQHTLSGTLTAIEYALRKLLNVPAPFDAIISSFGRWRDETGKAAE